MKAIDKLLKKSDKPDNTENNSENIIVKTDEKTEAKPTVKCIPLPRAILNKVPPPELL